MADVTNNKQNFKQGIQTKISNANISAPPTDAELDAAFGTPAVVGAGFVAVVDDNGADTASYLVWSTGAAWFHAAGTLST